MTALAFTVAPALAPLVYVARTTARDWRPVSRSGRSPPLSQCPWSCRRFAQSAVKARASQPFNKNLAVAFWGGWRSTAEEHEKEVPLEDRADFEQLPEMKQEKGFQQTVVAYARRMFGRADPRDHRGEMPLDAIASAVCDCTTCMRSRSDHPESYSQHPLTMRQPSIRIDHHIGTSRFVLLLADVLADSMVFGILSRVQCSSDFMEVILGIIAAYATADLVSGIAGWAESNFGADRSPKDECTQCVNNPPEKLIFAQIVAHPCAAVVPFFVLLHLMPAESVTIRDHAFACYFLSFLALLPAFREWSQSANPPAAIAVLQKAGIIIRSSTVQTWGRFEYYCVVSGLWNGLLARARFFAYLERLVFTLSRGRFRPKSWDLDPKARERACGPEDVYCEYIGEDRDQDM